MRIPFALLSISIATFMAGSANAQDWVQWDTASGGNGHWYKAVINTNNLNWTQVDQLARSEGGHLATISSDAENQFVFSLINSPEFFSGAGYNGSGPAIGGYHPDGEPAVDVGWSWETGEPWVYSNWGPGQPDDSLETRTHYWSGSQGVPASTWNNLSPTDANLGGYVIERESKTNASGFYGQTFIGASGGTLLSPLLGTPTRTFVTVYDSKGKMVGRVPSNPVGQFFAYEKPGDYTLVATQPSQPLPPNKRQAAATNGTNSVTVQITVYPNFMTPVQISFQAAQTASSSQ
jgi:hypothetical protein